MQILYSIKKVNFPRVVILLSRFGKAFKVKNIRKEIIDA